MLWKTFDLECKVTVAVQSQDIVAIVPHADQSQCLVSTTKGRMSAGGTLGQVLYDLRSQCDDVEMVVLTQNSSGLEFAVNRDMVRQVGVSDQLGTLIFVGGSCGCAQETPIDVKGTLDEVVAQLSVVGFDGTFLN